MDKKLKIGVLGARRGLALALGAKANGIEIAALCDQDENRLRHSAGRFADCRTFTDYSQMLDSDIDAVVLANYATEHVWAAKQALAAGKHVMSECMACFTMAEAVELIEAVEKSGRIYMFAENYPFFAQNLEMKRLFESGKYGKFIYGEGEYIHPIGAKEMATLTSSPQHWRNWIASTYYCTHSMGPIMNITGTWPVSVNGFVFPYDYDDPQNTESLRVGDGGSVIMCKMNNDAVVKLLPWSSLRDHGQRYRICCNRGTLEWNQGDSRLRIHTENFDFPDDPTHNQWYSPQFPAGHGEASRHGHGGGDYFTGYYFKKAIQTGIIEPKLDVYSAVQMTVIGIQAYRSALQNSNTMEIPDFRDPAQRDKYRNDHWNNDPARHCPGMPLPSIRGQVTPGEKALPIFQEERAKFEQKIAEG